MEALRKSLSAVILTVSASISGSLYATAAASDCRASLPTDINQDTDLSPLGMNFSASAKILGALNARLFDPTSEETPVGELISSYKEDKQNKSVILSVNQACKWSDGTSITADDIVRGLQFPFRHPKHLVDLRSAFFNGKEVESGALGLDALQIKVIDDATVAVPYAYSAQMLVSALAAGGITAIPADWPIDRDLPWTLDQLPEVVSGPFKIVSRKGNRLELARNPYFCQDRQEYLLDHISFINGLSWEEKVNAFLAGDLDVISNVPYPLVVSALNRLLEKDEITQASKQVTHAYSYMIYLFINQSREALRDANVKKALELLIDHEFILTNVLAGKASKLADSYTLEEPGYTPPVYPRSPLSYAEKVAQARELMQKAGYSADNKLPVEVLLRNNHLFFPIASAIADMLQQSYFEVSRRQAGEGKTYYGRMDNRDFDLALFQWWPGGSATKSLTTMEGLLDKKIADKAIYDELYAYLYEAMASQHKEGFHSRMRAFEQSLADHGFIIPLYDMTTQSLVDTRVFNRSHGTMESLLSRTLTCNENALISSSLQD